MKNKIILFIAIGLIRCKSSLDPLNPADPDYVPPTFSIDSMAIHTLTATVKSIDILRIILTPYSI